MAASVGPNAYVRHSANASPYNIAGKLPFATAIYLLEVYKQLLSLEKYEDSKRQVATEELLKAACFHLNDNQVHCLKGQIENADHGNGCEWTPSVLVEFLTELNSVVSQKYNFTE
jgi:hypothetical protein